MQEIVSIWKMRHQICGRNRGIQFGLRKRTYNNGNIVEIHLLMLTTELQFMMWIHVYSGFLTPLKPLQGVSLGSKFTGQWWNIDRLLPFDMSHLLISHRSVSVCVACTFKCRPTFVCMLYIYMHACVWWGLTHTHASMSTQHINLNKDKDKNKNKSEFLLEAPTLFSSVNVRPDRQTELRPTFPFTQKHFISIGFSQSGFIAKVLDFDTP